MRKADIPIMNTDMVDFIHCHLCKAYRYPNLGPSQYPLGTVKEEDSANVSVTLRAVLGCRRVKDRDGEREGQRETETEVEK